MIMAEMEQRSDEWYQARLGIPTASNFDKIVTSKGEPSKQAKKYMYQLAGEFVSGVPSENFQSNYMVIGAERENEAFAYYELVNDTAINQVGVCYKDEEKKFSCSPDGLIGDKGGLEAKNPAIHTHVEYLLQGALPTAYVQQVQGSLYITGREWWDFISYYPSLKPLIIRVEREEKFIKKLETALYEFCDELQEVIKKIS